MPPALPLPPRPAPGPLRALAPAILACLAASGCGDESTGAASPVIPAAAPPATAAPTTSTGPPEQAPSPKPSSALDPASGTRTPRFLARLELPARGKPTGLARADLDGDGRDELLATTREPGGLALWRGTASGPAVPPRVVSVGDWPLAPVVIATPEGPLVAVASQRERHVALLVLALDGEPRGLGRVALDHAPLRLAAGDLDGDGAAELVVATAGGELLLLPVTSAGFGKRRTLALDAERPTELLVSSAGEIVVATQDGHELIFVDPEGRRPEQRLSLEDAGGPAIPRALAEVDLDGDGDTELAIAGGDRTLWVLGLGAEAGAPGWRDSTPRRMPSTGLVPLALDAGDLNGDDLPELAVLHWLDQNFGIVGGFAESGAAPVLSPGSDVGQTPVALLLLDTDGDGKRDLAVANRDAGRVSVLFGTGFAEPGRPVFYAARQTSTGSDPVRVVTGDLDGDGRPEGVSLNASAGTVSVLPNRYVLVPGPEVPVGNGLRDLELVDADGDSALDLAVLAQGVRGSELRWLRGDGGGGLAPGDGPALEPLAFGRGGTRLATGALGDGPRNGLAVADPDDGAVYVIAPAAAGGFEAPRRFPVSGTPRDIYFLRAPGATPGAPGKPLLLVALDGPRGAGLGLIDPALEPAQAWTELPGAMPGGVAVAAVAADLDGDAALELVLLARGARDTSPGRIGTLFARGGAWVPGPRANAGLAPSALAAGDLDGDGRDDLIVTAQNSHHVNWWLSRGTASAPTLERQVDLGAHSGPLDVALADLDGDGDLELVVANAFSDDVSSLYQTGE